MIEFEEHYAPRKFFQLAGGFTAPDFTTFCNRHGIIKDEYGLYPTFEVIKGLNKDRKRLKNSKSSNKESDLEAELKKEKILKERINNQKQLRMLIPVDEAKSRIKASFLAVANMLRYAVKSSAPRVALSHNVRECENILINVYNDAIDKLKKDAKLQTWEDMSANTELRRVELSEDSKANISIGSGEENSSTVES